MSYPAPLTAQDCLVALMIAISASDTNIRTVELVKIQSAVNNLPVFADYDIDRVNLMSQTVFDLFEQEGWPGCVVRSDPRQPARAAV